MITQAMGAGHLKRTRILTPTLMGAKSAGIACEAYWYPCVDTVEKARQEAESFLSVIQGYQFEYPLAYDVKDAVQKKLSASRVSAIIETFCSIVEDVGYYVCIYSNASFLNTCLTSSIF